MIYSYDNLNRLTEVNYNNGQQIISYYYDAAGNMLSRTADEGQGPVLTVTSPVDGTYINTPSVTMSGIATDAGVGDSGIGSVTVNANPASGGTASGSDAASWSISVSLNSGINSLEVIATDGSPYANQTVKNINLTYIPFVTDTDGDGLDDAFELAIGTDPDNPDTDWDGITDGQELAFDGDGSYYNYYTDTDPQNSDSDGDGVNDGEEIAAGTNPLDNTSYPITHDGDLNGDGEVNAADVLIAERILLGKITPTQDQLDHGDVAPLIDGVPMSDGLFNLGDVLVIQRKALGLIN